MKKYLLFALIVCAAIKAGATDIGGILGNMTLTKANSPYHITKNILIPSGVKVVIDPGVEVLVDPNLFIQVNGTLRAIGTIEDSIYFKISQNAPYWNGIKFSGTSESYDPKSGEGSVISFASFKIGEFWLHSDDIAAIDIVDCSPKISNNTIAGGAVGIKINALSLYSTISNNRIYGGFIGIGVEGNVTIVENEIFAIFHAPISISVGDVYVVNNEIHNSGYGIVLNDEYYPSSFNIIGNFFHDNYNASVYGDTKNIAINCNTFKDNNGPNISLGCTYIPKSIKGNNFLNYTKANVAIGDAFNCYITLPEGTFFLPLEIENNYWNGLSENEIEKSILDFEDDFSKKIKVVVVSTSSDSLLYDSAYCFAGTVTSVMQPNDKITNSINVFPNPSVGGVLTFTTDDCTIEEITLVNALNQQEVTKGTKVESTFKGLVTAIVKTNKGIFNKKIIIY
ncbi:MAG: right-handed parallel beta-helix repeat-containing protein [Sporocytophaga sp.]|uniref:right-handed parallel beta-helix repeat-containing protein n=1 Tax=Sporocytophaga sp. TaxID=2231183 RepID=UPI001B068CA5|nr:right-handed parallel beta-helix repeat-containing protein [Sporocytophaga sp.]MBO9698770.1 right-handed parallel beta-helix repeat-containing protein [Sporocytophaga sp.]